MPRKIPHILSPNKQNGFTLVELMVVMAIIAILATAGLSAYTSYLKGTRDSVRATVAREIVTKAEQYSSIYGASTPTQMTAYLTAEGLTIKDPLGWKPVCIDSFGRARMVCQIDYYQFSDGTYAVSYGVEKTKDLVNPHYSGKLEITPGDGHEVYGSFIGNNKTLSIIPSPITTKIENKSDLTSAGITVIASALTSSGSFLNTSLLANWAACTTGSQCNGWYCGHFLCSDGSDTSPCDDGSQCLGGSCVGFMGPKQCITWTPV